MGSHAEWMILIFFILCCMPFDKISNLRPAFNKTACSMSQCLLVYIGILSRHVDIIQCLRQLLISHFSDHHRKCSSMVGWMEAFNDEQNPFTLSNWLGQTSKHYIKNPFYDVLMTWTAGTTLVFHEITFMGLTHSVHRPYEGIIKNNNAHRASGCSTVM